MSLRQIDGREALRSAPPLPAPPPFKDASVVHLGIEDYQALLGDKEKEQKKSVAHVLAHSSSPVSVVKAISAAVIKSELSWRNKIDHEWLKKEELTEYCQAVYHMWSISPRLALRRPKGSHAELSNNPFSSPGRAKRNKNSPKLRYHFVGDGFKPVASAAVVPIIRLRTQAGLRTFGILQTNITPSSCDIDMFGGKVDKGDTNLMETIARELLEESGALIGQRIFNSVAKFKPDLSKSQAVYIPASKYQVTFLPVTNLQDAVTWATLPQLYHYVYKCVARKGRKGGLVIPVEFTKKEILVSTPYPSVLKVQTTAIGHIREEDYPVLDVSISVANELAAVFESPATLFFGADLNVIAAILKT